LTNSEKCDGCNDCVEACAKVNGESSIFLHKMTDGYQAILCQQCINPSCMRGCFRDAIYRENDVVHIDQDSCVGCRLCMLMCPIGCITHTEDQILKCEQQCLQSENDIPACVKSCSEGCLEVVDV